MMVNKKGKFLGACALVLATVLSGMSLPAVYAAEAVDIHRTCTAEFSVDTEELSMPVKLYKVDDMKATGDYEAVAGFESLQVDQVNDKMTAAKWEEMTVRAKELLTDDVEPVAIVHLENGRGAADNLPVGMYLIVADEVKMQNITYTFKDSMISMPNNYYYRNENNDWIYDLTGKYAVSLKMAFTEEGTSPETTEMVEEVKTGDDAEVPGLLLLVLVSGGMLLIMAVVAVKKHQFIKKEKKDR